MFRMIALCAAFTVATPAAFATGIQEEAPAGIYKTDPSHSTLTWSFDHFGLSQYTARFTGVEARLDWRPAKPESSVLTVTIDPMSARTDYPWPERVDFDAQIGGGPDFLAGAPITFVSKAIEVTGEKTGRVDGVLSFRGIARLASLDVTFNGSMADHPMMGTAKLGFSATAVIRRSEWGLDFAIPALGDEVRIVVETQLVPEDFEL